MADKKISDLDPIVTPSFSDIREVVQGGVNYKETNEQLRDLLFKNQAMWERMLINSDPKYGVAIRSDFTEYSAGLPLGWTSAGSGSGEAFSLVQTKGISGYVGEARTRLQTAAGYFWNTYGSASVPRLKMGLGKLVYEHRWTPSAFGADTGFFRSGIGGTSPASDADEVNGIYIEYDTRQSANWRYCTAASSSRAKTNSSVAFSAATHILRFEVASDWQSVEFFVDGVSLGVQTVAGGAQMPSTAVLCLAVSGYKASGNTQQAQYHNYIDFQYLYNTPLVA
jgi:hypothetical protein